jgi:hypothetical protein
LKLSPSIKIELITTLCYQHECDLNTQLYNELNINIKKTTYNYLYDKLYHRVYTELNKIYFHTHKTIESN